MSAQGSQDGGSYLVDSQQLHTFHVAAARPVAEIQMAGMEETSLAESPVSFSRIVRKPDLLLAGAEKSIVGVRQTRRCAWDPRHWTPPLRPRIQCCQLPEWQPAKDLGWLGDPLSDILKAAPLHSAPGKHHTHAVPALQIVRKLRKPSGKPPLGRPCRAGMQDNQRPVCRHKSSGFRQLPFREEQFRTV